MTRGILSGVLIGGALGCAACGGQSSAVHVSLDPMPPVGIDDHVVFVDRARTEARLLDVSKGTAPSAPTVVPLVAKPTKIAVRRAHSEELLVLSAGQPDDGTAPFARPGLVVISESGTRREYRYDTAYDAMAQSDDGKYAFLYFDKDASTSGGTGLFNPNEVAVVNLDGSDTPHVRSLLSFGESPQSVWLSEMTLGGAPRHLAVVVFGSDVAVMDLDHLDRHESTLPLTTGIHLAQVVFSQTAPKIYLRANDSNDIFVVSLTDGQSAPSGPPSGDAGARSATENDFAPLSDSVLPGGTGPSDMLLYTDTQTLDADQKPVGEQLLIAAQGSAVLIDPNSNKVIQVQLPGPASNCLLFAQGKPSHPAPEQRALFYTPGAAAVAFVDLRDIQTRGPLNVELLTLPEPYGKVVPLDANTVMLLHQGTGLGLLDLAERTVTAIQGPNLLGAIPDPSAKVKKLWLSIGDRVDFLQFSGSVQPGEVRVDATIEDLVPVPSSTRPRVVVTHPSSMGWATMLDAMDPTNLKMAYSMRGFLLSGALGGG